MMRRREFVRMLSAAGAGAMLSNPLRPVQSQPLPIHPNVLFVILDDGNDWFGFMDGHPDTLTPNIDSFAGSGTVFSNAYCCAPVCNPSRTAIYTGLRPSTSGVYTNQDHWEDHLGSDYPTMPDRFHEAGYSNGLVGKFYPSLIDLDAWDFRFRIPDYHTLNGYDPYLPNHPFNGLNQSFVGYGADFNWGANDEAESLMQDSLRTEFVVNQLTAGVPEPFFLALGTNVPHLPHTIPRKYMERFDPATIELPPYNPNDADDIPPVGESWIRLALHRQVVDHKQWRKAVQAYLAGLSFLDDRVGSILTALDSSPHANNTVVIFTSDHGYHLGEKSHWRKATLWDRSLHVPLAIRVPGVTSPGSVCTEPVSLLDLYPTLIEMCNLDAVPGLDGQSLVPQLTDPLIPTTQPAISTHGPGNHSVCDGRYRYIKYEDLGEELYDHANDPNEWTNVADDPAYATIKAELESWLPAGLGR